MDVVSRDWGACGLAYLTGLPDGPPDFSRAAVPARARCVAADLGVRIGVDPDTANLVGLPAAVVGEAAPARPVVVESTLRPDGTRAGPRSFFDWMNGGQLSYAADFDDPAALRALLAVADVVLPSSRPAALQHRGLGPDDVPAHDGRVWLRTTGHGAAELGADNAHVDRMFTERRLAPC